MENHQKKLIAIALLIVAAFAVAGFTRPQHAQANAFDSFLNSLIAPFKGTSTAGPLIGGSVPTASTTPLYQPVVDYENAVVNAVKQASPAVVSITISENVPVVEQCPYDPFGNLSPDFQQFFGGGSSMTVPCNSGKTQLQQVGGGSGFIISSDGLILTNKHVVSDIGASYSVLTNDGKTYDATVLARDPSQDLAVLKIKASGLPTVTLGDSGSLELGQSAIAIGNALGQFSNTVSVGVVSGLERTVTAAAPDTGAEETIAGVIQTDAAINPGNSGGPLLNLQGQVIGIDTAVAEDAQGIGFAIPINQAKRDIASVETTGNIVAPYLGVRYVPLDPATANENGLSVNYGAWVKGSSSSAPAVQPNSPAAKAGVQAGDIITAIDGTPIDATHDLATMVNQHSVGDTVTLTISRGGKQLSVQATLTQRPAGS
ncbi:MAG TPA: trypsin-like peptidase domain-containing protein [Candidatus Paceibacterota bacterium]|nr:trypsin-like peptidase domain-containing protein [Candidatus Paceibacterota bacterium]